MVSELEEALVGVLRLAGLPEPIREYRFAAERGRRFRADLAYPDRLLLIECEGGIWSGGRHTSGAGYSRDVEKYNLATLMGFKVLRFTRAMIADGTALQTIEEALRG